MIKEDLSQTLDEREQDLLEQLQLCEDRILDDMTEQAFDDQCTGANPRYPLISEIKEMYMNAYYGGER